MPERIDIATPDGTMPVWRQGSGAVGLIVFMDVFGIRPEFHEMCADLAKHGYTVFLPHLFYRAGPVAFSPAEALPPLARELNATTTWAMTAADMGAFFAAVPTPDAFVTAGFCMGARHALATTARHPTRVRACALLHGGRLVTDDASSPHHLIGTLSVPAYVAFAHDDPTCPPEHQAIIEAALDASPQPHTAERFAARHGFTFPERDVFDADAAASAKNAMLTVFDRAIEGVEVP